MNEQQPQSIGARLREIFSGKTEIVTSYGDAVLTHKLREPTADEDVFFRRQSTAIKLIGSRAVPADEAFRAPISLYDRITESVSVEIDGETHDLPDFTNRIPPDLKAAVISAFQTRFNIVVQKSRNGVPSQDGESK